MMRRVVVSSAVLGVVSFLVLEARAHACGGCFAPPGPFTAVGSHRMVIKLGAEETILWDQFVYTGEPEEFAWVLPVPTPDAIVELADAAFVQQMDELTTPIVQPATLSCGAAEAGGCGGGGGGAFPLDAVTVYDHRVVGPYDTVVIGSEDPTALYAWLGANGYAFPDSALPTLQYYTDQGSAFVVLRLRPGKDVTAMQPVRVRFAGFMGTFPLKMVVIGAGGVIDLSLWVIAEQRYAAHNYPTVRVDENALAWDWATSTSNYEEAFDDAIDQAGGRAWVTEYAAALLRSELADALFAQAPDDFMAAVTKLPAPYVTRLRTRMLIDHIDQDLQLAPAEDPTDVPRTIYARRGEDERCPEAAALSVSGSGGLGGTNAWTVLCLLMAAAGASWIVRRRVTC